MIKIIFYKEKIDLTWKIKEEIRRLNMICNGANVHERANVLSILNCALIIDDLEIINQAIKRAQEIR